ncbi:tetratricopeptide repeat protein [Planctomycetota bacterium]
MRITRLFATVSLLLVIETITGAALESTAGTASLGSTVVPPSAYSNDQTTTQDAEPIPGNLMVTGNVGSGKHFRGNIPYQAPQTLKTRMGTTQMDSFYRQSASSKTLPQSSGGYVPFYSSAGTAAHTRPGRTQPYTAPLPSRGTFLPATRVSPADPGQFRFSTPPIDRQMPLRVPVSKTLQQVKTRLRRDFPNTFPQETWERLLQADPTHPRARTIQEDSPVTPGEVSSLTHEAWAAQQPATDLPYQMPTPTESETPTIGKPPMFHARRVTDSYLKPDSDQELSIDPFEDQAAENKLLIPLSESEFLTDPTLVTVSTVDLPPDQRAAPAQAIPGTHSTLVAFTEQRFSDLMAMADAYLKTGRHTEAVDTYTLALAFQPQDPLAWAGKGHALLACREYVSSALFLSRALEAFPAYARFPVALGELMGGDMALQERLEEARRLMETSEAHELMFLMAYLYHRIGDKNHAEAMIGRLRHVNPKAAGLAVLEAAIRAAR